MSYDYSNGIPLPTVYPPAPPEQGGPPTIVPPPPRQGRPTVPASVVALMYQPPVVSPPPQNGPVSVVPLAPAPNTPVTVVPPPPSQSNTRERGVSSLISHVRRTHQRRSNPYSTDHKQTGDHDLDFYIVFLPPISSLLGPRVGVGDHGTAFDMNMPPPLPHPGGDRRVEVGDGQASQPRVPCPNDRTPVGQKK